MLDVLSQKIDAYYGAREAYDKAHQLSVQADAVRRLKEAELVSYMIENQIKKVSREDGTTPMLVRGVTISVTQENYDAIREWLKGATGDDADFIVTIPHKPAILEYVKKRIEQGDDEKDMPAFLSCSTRPTLRVDGWKQR